MGLFGGGNQGKATIAGAQQIGKNVEQYHKDTDRNLLEAGGAARGYLSQIGGLYQPMAAIGQQGTSLYADSLGINGADGNARAVGAFQTGPGYDFAMGQGLDALERRAAAQGRLQSGQTGLDTLTYAQGLANQEYGNWQNRLSGLGSLWQTGVAGQAGGLGALADLDLGIADRRNDVYGKALGVNTQATQMFAGGQETREAAKQAGFNSLLGLGGSLLGKAAGAGSLGALGSFFGYGK